MRGGAYYSTVATLLMGAVQPAGAGDAALLPQRQRYPDLEPDAVVEINALVNRNGVRRWRQTALPAADLRGLIQSVKAYESRTVEASVNHSRTMAVEALMHHPDQRLWKRGGDRGRPV